MRLLAVVQRVLVGVLVVAFAACASACGGSVSAEETLAGEAPEAEELALRSLVSPSQGPLPAGRWAAESETATSCVDCPTPRFAVVAAEGTLADMAQARRDTPGLAPGYPMVFGRGEWSLALQGEFALVLGLYQVRLDAEVEARSHGGRVMAVRPDPSPDAPRAEEQGAGGSSVSASTDRDAFHDLVLTVREDAPAYPMHLRNGALPDVPPAPECIVSAGTIMLVGRGDVLSVPGGTPWVRVTCPGGPALVEGQWTDLALTTERWNGGARTTQRLGGACGLIHFRREDSDGTVRSLWSRPGCFDAHHGEDPWRACPTWRLHSCVTRVEQVVADDRRHALRLLSYACRFGELNACERLGALTGDAGVALRARWDACRRARPASDACEAFDEALAETSPASLPDAAALAAAACERGHEAWCVFLAEQPACDRDGCG